MYKNCKIIEVTIWNKDIWQRVTRRLEYAKKSKISELQVYQESRYKD